MGLSIAYNLARRGLTDVLVLERGYLAEGASGRNGGGVRAQWSSELNIRLMQRSVELCREFAVELGVNVWFRQGGYLFLARTPDELARFARNAALQNRHGVRTRIVSPDEAAQLVPQLDRRRLAGAAYNPDDGIVFPWPFLWGYARRAAELGVTIATHTPVVGIDAPGRGFVVHTARGPVHARRVVNACGAWSPAIAAMVGVSLPTWPVRHEICSSEPLKPFLGPMVSEPATGLYFSQSMRGEIVGGISWAGHGHGARAADPSAAMGSSLAFLATYARRLLRVAPGLADVKVLRQWAGPYDESPDGSPLLGAPAAVPEFYLAGGFVGRGFMMAPVIGELYGAWLTGGAPHEAFARWHVDRFASGVVRREEDFDIG
jgi:sarcosine oxidase subunit beta